MISSVRYANENVDRRKSFQRFRKKSQISAPTASALPPVAATAYAPYGKPPCRRTGPCLSRYGTKATRKPRMLNRLTGVILLRIADRQNLAVLIQLPPRSTRLEPTRCQADHHYVLYPDGFHIWKLKQLQFFEQLLSKIPRLNVGGFAKGKQRLSNFLELQPMPHGRR